MLDFIVKYWIQELFVLIISVLTWCVGKLRKKHNENDKVKEGMMALLHDRLYQACSFFLKRGWCSIEDRNNLEYLFRPYKELGGNGTGEHLYKRCLDLPYDEEGVIVRDEMIKAGKTRAKAAAKSTNVTGNKTK